jgi:hypothetical protein
MKPRLRKALAIAWLAIAIPFGAVAALQLYSMLAGVYDPVAADHMRPESVPSHRALLIAIIGVTFISSLIAGWYVRHTSQRA